MAEAMNCWTLRFGALRDFAIGRLVQPASMALLQVVFGLAEGGGSAMILAHILSQAVLIAYFCVRVFGWQDIREIGRAPWRGAMAAARSEYKFPLFDLPANLAGYAIINVPALLIGSLFGSAFAGYFGVAARLTSGPTTLMAAPLSTVFVAEASKVRDMRLLRDTAGILLVLTGVLISLPVLVMGIVAPYFVGPLLGQAWLVTGQIMTALAIMGAAQALSTPLQEVPTLLRRQEVRFSVDAVRTALVFGPLIAGARAGWDPLFVIYTMSIGGTLGFLLRTASSLYLLMDKRAPEGTVSTNARGNSR
jgi:O-antigen/teichoic acid export membrane protein